MTALTTKYPDLKTLVYERAGYKRKITQTLDALGKGFQMCDFKIYSESVLENLSVVGKLDKKVSDFLLKLEPFDQETYDCEIDSQGDYSLQTKIKLSSFCQNESSTKSKISENLPDFKLKLPELNCDHFSGEGATDLEFHTFKTQFDNVVGMHTNLSNITKHYISTNLSLIFI